ncbi:MAG: hypothetical protein R6X13_08990 [bacterium]
MPKPRPRWLLPLFLVLACHRPGWETTLTVPIISRRFTIDDLRFVPFIGHVRPGPNEVLQLDIDYTLDTLRAEDLLGALSGEGNTEFALPDFLLSPVGAASVGLPVAALAGMPIGDSVFVPVPAFARDTAVAVELVGVDSVAATSAVLRVSVDNRTDLEFDSVRVEMPVSGEPVFSGAVPARASVLQRSAVGPAVIRRGLSAFVRVVSGGSGGEPVWLRAQDSLLVTVAVDSLRIEAGRLSLGQATAVEAVREDTLFLGGRYRVRLDSARFGTGLVAVALANDLPFAVRCSLALDEIGQTHMLDIGPRDSLGWLVDLHDAIYLNRNPDSSQLTLSCRVEGLLTGEPVELRPGDGVRIAARADSVGLEYVRGWATDTIWSPVLRDSLSWTVPESLRELPIRLSSVRLVGEVTTGFNLAGVFELELRASAPGGATAVESLRFSLPPGLPEQPGIGRFEVEVADLLNIVPDRLAVSGRAGLAGAAEFWSRSFVTGQGSAVVPLRVKVLPFTDSIGPWTVPLDSVLRKFARGYVRGAEVEASVSNHLPLGVRAELLLWSGGTDTVRVPIDVPTPRLDPTGGWVVAPVDTTVVASLDSSGVAVLQFEPCFAALLLQFPETDTVALRSLDYFQVDPALLRLDVDIQER